MNELMITYENGNWLYYKTNTSSAKEAYDELLRKIENIGINADNMHAASICLRDVDGKDIDKLYILQ